MPLNEYNVYKMGPCCRERESFIYTSKRAKFVYSERRLDTMQLYCMKFGEWCRHKCVIHGMKHPVHVLFEGGWYWMNVSFGVLIHGLNISEINKNHSTTSLWKPFFSGTPHYTCWVFSPLQLLLRYHSILHISAVFHTTFSPRQRDNRALRSLFTLH